MYSVPKKLPYISDLKRSLIHRSERMSLVLRCSTHVVLVHDAILWNNCNDSEDLEIAKLLTRVTIVNDEGRAVSKIGNRNQILFWASGGNNAQSSCPISIHSGRSIIRRCPLFLGLEK